MTHLVLIIFQSVLFSRQMTKLRSERTSVTEAGRETAEVEESDVGPRRFQSQQGHLGPPEGILNGKL